MLSETGLIHIYSGDGKGKTTAAFGLAVRFVAYGGKVAIFQFLKDASSGESVFLKNLNLDSINIFASQKKLPFYWTANEEEKKEISEETQKLFDRAVQFAENKNIELLILDEVLDVINNKLIDEKNVLEICDLCKKNSIELVITGRNPSEILLQKCDYHSDIVLKKHPFYSGISARAGIEY